MLVEFPPDIPGCGPTPALRDDLQLNASVIDVIAPATCRRFPVRLFDRYIGPSTGSAAEASRLWPVLVVPGSQQDSSGYAVAERQRRGRPALLMRLQWSRRPICCRARRVGARRHPASQEIRRRQRTADAPCAR
jgi:hypothetical protein